MRVNYSFYLVDRKGSPLFIESGVNVKGYSNCIITNLFEKKSGSGTTSKTIIFDNNSLHSVFDSILAIPLNEQQLLIQQFNDLRTKLSQIDVVNNGYGERWNTIYSSGKTSNETENVNEQAQEQSESEQPQEQLSDEQKTELIKEKVNETYEKLCLFLKEFELSEEEPIIDSRLLFNLLNIDNLKAFTKTLCCLYDVQVHNEYLSDLVEKTKSQEWKDLVNEWLDFKKKYSFNIKPINHRLNIKYGVFSSGKTFSIMQAFPNIKKISCTSDLTEQELFYNYVIDSSGKPTLVKSNLLLAMENGEPILLDEINHLAPVCQESLQQITDNSDYYDIQATGERIYIKDGFKVYGTMNNVKDGEHLGLARGLVSRIETIEKTEITKGQLNAMSEIEFIA